MGMLAASWVWGLETFLFTMLPVGTSVSDFVHSRSWIGWESRGCRKTMNTRSWNILWAWIQRYSPCPFRPPPIHPGKGPGCGGGGMITLSQICTGIAEKVMQGVGFILHSNGILKMLLFSLRTCSQRLKKRERCPEKNTTKKNTIHPPPPLAWRPPKQTNSNNNNKMEQKQINKHGEKMEENPPTLLTSYAWQKPKARIASGTPTPVSF